MKKPAVLVLGLVLGLLLMSALAWALPPCPPGYHWSPRWEQCVPNGPGPGYAPPPPVVVPPACPPGTHWSHNEGGCVPNRPHCGPYMHWSDRFQQCVPNCPPGMHYSPRAGGCVPN